MKNKLKIFILIIFFVPLAKAQTTYPSPVRPGNEPIGSGMFEPTWQSLQQYKIPDWYRNAKFGIWAHWGPQCQPELGDW